ncbi:MAG: creatininase family protein [Cyanobacteriota bacterium]
MSSFHKLEELRPETLKSFDRERTIFFVTVSPLENHGNHLPYGTDIFEGEGISKAIAEKLIIDKPDWNIVFCQPITLGFGTMPGFGSINIRQSVVRDFLKDYFSGIAKLGFKFIFVSGFHGNPKHLTAVDEAIVFVNKKYKAKIISPFGYSFMNVFSGREKIPSEEINAIFKKNKYDIHGGIFETSLVMYLRPDLVKGNENQKEINLSIKNPLKKIKAVKDAFSNGYFGNPAEASQDIGKKLLDDIIGLFYNVLINTIEEEGYYKKVRNIFYYHPYTRTGFLKKASFLLASISLPILFVMKKNKNPEIEKLFLKFFKNTDK